MSKLFMGDVRVRFGTSIDELVQGFIQRRMTLFTRAGFGLAEVFLQRVLERIDSAAQCLVATSIDPDRRAFVATVFDASSKCFDGKNFSKARFAVDINDSGFAFVYDLCDKPREIGEIFFASDGSSRVELPLCHDAFSIERVDVDRDVEPLENMLAHALELVRVEGDVVDL